MFQVGEIVRVVGASHPLRLGEKHVVRHVGTDYVSLVGIEGVWLYDRFEKVLPTICRVTKHKEEYRDKIRPLNEAVHRANDPATSKGKRKVNKYEQAVLDILKGLYKGQGYTGKQIASLTGHPLNCITPRFAPLRRKGLIAPLYSEGYGHPVVKRDKQIVWVLA